MSFINERKLRRLRYFKLYSYSFQSNCRRLDIFNFHTLNGAKASFINYFAHYEIDYVRPSIDRAEIPIYSLKAYKRNFAGVV